MDFIVAVTITAQSMVRKSASTDSERLLAGAPVLAMLSGGRPTQAQEIAAPKPPHSVASASDAAALNPIQFLAFADRARHAGNYRSAETADCTLAASIDIELRTEARFGLAKLPADRVAACDPGYSAASGRASVYAFHEVGKTTLVANLGYSHLEADARLFPCPRHRIDDRLNAGLSETFRARHLRELAKIMCLIWERNRSTIGNYDYTRLSGEVGITAAF